MRFRFLLLTTLALGWLLQAQQPPARAIDPLTSTLTVYAYKSGLFAFAAHDHEISAPIASGEVVLANDTPRVRLVVDARQMKVLDPKLEAEKRAEVQETMQSAKVLDTAKYPQIVFESTRIRKVSGGRWEVSGELELHGTKEPLTFDVVETGGSYTGEVRFKQSSYGIKPISIAGGSIKVKDEVKIAFTVRLRG